MARGDEMKNIFKIVNNPRNCHRTNAKCVIKRVNSCFIINCNHRGVLSM